MSERTERIVRAIENEVGAALVLAEGPRRASRRIAPLVERVIDAAVRAAGCPEGGGPSCEACHDAIWEAALSALEAA